MSTAKKNKKKAQKKQHVSPPAVKPAQSSVAKLKKPVVKPTQKKRSGSIRKILYVAAAIFLVLNGGVFLLTPRDQGPTSGQSNVTREDFQRTPVSSSEEDSSSSGVVITPTVRTDD